LLIIYTTMAALLKDMAGGRSHQVRAETAHSFLSRIRDRVHQMTWTDSVWASMARGIKSPLPNKGPKPCKGLVADHAGTFQRRDDSASVRLAGHDPG